LLGTEWLQTVLTVHVVLTVNAVLTVHMVLTVNAVLTVHMVLTVQAPGATWGGGEARVQE
jgi:hypothetical protein